MMIFKRFENDGCLSYMVGCNEELECMVIDPHIDANPYIGEARELDMNITTVLDTHSHADHLTGAGALRDEVGASVVMCKQYEAQREATAGKGKDIGIADILEFNAGIDVDRTVADGDLLEVGNENLLAQETPGHTIDSISALGGGRAFTGDALLIGQIGRPDFPGGNVASMYSTITKLKNLSEELLIYPAHDYTGNYNTSLGYEIANNEFLLAKSLDEFKETIGSRFPKLTKKSGKLQCGVTEEAPATVFAEGKSGDGGMMDVMCAAMEGMFKKMPKDWNVTSAKALNSTMKSKEKPFLLDVRTTQEYATGHISGAVNIHVRELPGSMDKLPAEHGTPIVAIYQSGNRSAYATMYLRGIGYSNVKNLDYGIAGWEDEGLSITKDKNGGTKKKTGGTGKKKSGKGAKSGKGS